MKKAIEVFAALGIAVCAALHLFSVQPAPGWWLLVVVFIGVIGIGGIVNAFSPFSGPGPGKVTSCIVGSVSIGWGLMVGAAAVSSCLATGHVAGRDVLAILSFSGLGVFTGLYLMASLEGSAPSPQAPVPARTENTE